MTESQKRSKRRIGIGLAYGWTMETIFGPQKEITSEKRW
jgi:hypothetical protein